MKILIIGPNVGVGGVERASSNLANGLKKEGHDVVYLALIPEVHFFKLDTKYIEPVGFNETKMDFLKTTKYIRKNVKKFNPDHIITFTKFYAALANFALIFTKFQIYVTERSSPLYVWPKHIESFCKISFRLKKPAGIISQTSIASEYHKKYYGNNKYIVIPNVVREIKSYPEIQRENIILAVGRFQDSCKGFDLLVQAFNLVEDKTWRLLFAGGNAEDGEYLLELANPEKAKRIEFLGMVSDMDLVYARAGMFVMPSRSEGYPNALAEANAAGCACISFDFIAGPRDIVDDNINGLIVEAENIVLLAEAIDRLIIDNDLRKKFQRNATEKNMLLNNQVIIGKHLKFLEN